MIEFAHRLAHMHFCLQRGGAVQIEGSGLSSQNKSLTAGGTDLNLVSCDFRDNHAMKKGNGNSGRGGAMYLQGVTNLVSRASTFSNNRAVCFHCARLARSYSRCFVCWQALAGGALFLTDQRGPVICEECTFVDNQFFEVKEQLFNGKRDYGDKPWYRSFQNNFQKNVATVLDISDLSHISSAEVLKGHILYLSFGEKIGSGRDRLTCKKCTLDSSTVKFRLLPVR